MTSPLASTQFASLQSIDNKCGNPKATQLSPASQRFAQLARDHRSGATPEDLIIDALANRHLLNVPRSPPNNPWLKNPFKRRPLFTFTDNVLHVDGSTRYGLLRSLFIKFGFEAFITRFEACFHYFLSNQDWFLGAFGQLQHPPPETFPSGAVLLVIMLSRLFKRRYVTYLLEFLLLFEFLLDQRCSSEAEKRRLVGETLAREEDFSMVEFTGYWHHQITGSAGDPSLPPRLLGSLYAIYLDGNGLLSAEETDYPSPD